MFQLTFPAVTICNNNRVNCNQLDNVIETVTGSADETDNQTLISLIKIKTLACPDDAPGTQTMGRKKRDVQQAPPMEMEGLTPDWLTTEYEFLSVYMELNESIRHKIGHPFSAMIKACTFQGKNCLDSRYLFFEYAYIGNIKFMFQFV